LLEWFLFFVGGFLLGGYGGALGQGTGILGLPLIVGFFNASFPVARAACLINNIPLSLAAVQRHRKAGRSFKGISFLTSGMIFGVFAGFFLQTQVCIEDLWLLYSLFLLLVLLAFFFRQKLSSGKNFEKSFHFRPLPVIFIGFFAGIFCGAIGVGGGALIVPGLSLFGGVSLKRSMVMSNAVIILGSSVGLIFNWNFEAFFLCLAMIPGIMIGAYYGAHLGQKLPEKIIRFVFCLVIVLVLIKVNWKYLLWIF
jgi:uncharacterized membrane protein YfcA